MNIPGFFAENSLGNIPKYAYRSAARYSATKAGAVIAQLPGVTCVRRCINGDCGYVECAITGDDPGGWGVNIGGNQEQRECARCKAGCYRLPAGNARRTCLLNCIDLVC